MIEQLRIKCPSCGIILDIRNSRHEAVKRITCPNCQKPLEVNFEEDDKPVAPPKAIEPLYYGEMRIDLQEGINHIPLADCDFVEIKVVILRDGNNKCLVHPLDDEHIVLVNQQPLSSDDQVTLATGDQLQVGNTVLRRGKLGSIEVFHPEPPAPPQPKPEPPKRNRVWLTTAISCAILAVATILLWPSVKQEPVIPKQLAQNVDTVKKPEGDTPITKEVEEGKGGKKTVDTPTTICPPPSTTKTDHPLTKLSDYELEKKAVKGNVEAQYELGNRLVHRSGASNVIRGLKYLKMAANNGSSKARNTWQKAVNALQRKAERGDSLAYYILKSI